MSESQQDQQICLPAEIPTGFSGWLVSGAVILAWSWRLISPKLRARKPELFGGGVDEFLDEVAEILLARPTLRGSSKLALKQALANPPHLADILDPDSPVQLPGVEGSTGLAANEVAELKAFLHSRRRRKSETPPP